MTCPHCQNLGCFSQLTYPHRPQVLLSPIPHQQEWSHHWTPLSQPQQGELNPQRATDTPACVPFLSQYIPVP